MTSTFQIPRPDQKAETLGLTVLDEPCAKQSDPIVLDLRLRAVSKQSTMKQVVSVSLRYYTLAFTKFTCSC